MGMIRFLFRNLKGHRTLIGVAVVLTFAQVGSDLLAAFPLKLILDKIVDHEDPRPPFPGALHFFDRFGIRAGLWQGEEHTQAGVILFSASMVVLLGLLSALLSHIQLFLAVFIGQNLAARLRNQLFGHMQRLPLDWHARQKTGDLVQRVTGGVADIEKFVTDGLVDLLAGTLTLCGIIVVMSLAAPQFTLLAVIIVPALFTVVLGYTRSIKLATKRAAKAAGEVADVATEDLGAIVEVKAFTLEKREALRFGRHVEQNREAVLRAGRLQSQFTPLVGMIIAADTALIVGIGSYVASGHTFTLGFLTIPGGSLTVGTLTVFLAYLKQLYQPMRNLSKLTNLATSAASGLGRIREVLDQALEVDRNGIPYSGSERLRGEIAYEGVVFGYVEGQPVLKGIDLHIPAGRKVALVGLSGSGKTTMVKLIPRLHEIWAGSLKIDGVDHRKYPLNVLRRNVGLVLQDSVLFGGTIRENIAIGCQGAADEDIIDAAKKAHINDFIMSLEKGYDALVWEQGKNLSGGQRQCLAIARAILRDSPILILDEPTSSLDVEAEAEVMHALDKLIIGRTVLIISHRLSTLGNVDEIVVLKDGHIVERGTFGELRRSRCEFAKLLEGQNRYNPDRTDGIREGRQQQAYQRRAGDGRGLLTEPDSVRAPNRAASWDEARNDMDRNSIK